MKLDHNLLSELFQKYLSNEATETEKQEFLSYVYDPLYKEQIQELLSGAFENQTEIRDVNDEIRYRMLNQIFKEEKLPKVRQTKLLRLWLPLAVAAMVVIVGTAILYFPKKTDPVDQSHLLSNDIKPGDNKAYLTLANGTRIALTDAKNGELAKQAGVTITKTAGGKVIYSVENANHIGPPSNAYNLIETPKGGQYQIHLPDGTAVWLNAASSLKYPSCFTRSKERRVVLKGEAYFEVAKDKTRPFIVSTDKQEVEVLGTHFNINSYADELETKTTLLEGLVRLNGKTILKPGEQATLKANEISIAEVNVNKTVAWKNGKFVFVSEDLESIMRKLARWYNVDVVFEGTFKDETFTGSISRYDNISRILDKITFTQAVRFKIEGRRVTVMK